VAIARAIAKRPDVILCDEPTGALDVETGRLVLGTLVDINAQLGTTTAIITHNVVIAGIADRVLRMTGGHIVDVHENATRVPVASLAW
jgi:putative ABC transport system ATP-binding protein